MSDINNENFDPKYGQLPEDLVNLLKNYELEYFREDKPIPFGKLTIYPATVRNYEVFSNCCSCLTLNKNENVEGLRCTNLEYLLRKTVIKENDEGRMWSYRIQKLIEIIFHITNGIKCKKCGKILTYDSPEFIKFINELKTFSTLSQEEMEKSTPPSLACPECEGKDFIEMIKIVQDPQTKKYSLMVDGETITPQDFNKLRQIVMYQNYPDYADESWIDPDVKKDHDEKLRLEQQKNDVHASIEKKVICLSISTHYKFEEIYNMSIRKFTMALATVDDLINYKIMKQASMSGFVSLPKGKSIEHWIYKPNKDIYGDSYKDTEQVQQTVSNL